MKLPRLIICLLGALLALLLGQPTHAARLALVIGNKDYKVGALKNPVNDALAMSQTLTELGFAVTTVKNLRRDDIGRTVDGFASRIKAGDDVVVFYAGHGVQVKGVNYLPAVDANIAVESDVALNSLNLNQLLDRLDEAKSGVRLLLIDACRDNPYSRSFRSGSRGLARVEGAPSGTLMHFATRPGGVAADGSAANGLYTSELLKHLKTPGLPVESMLKRVAAGVKQASSGDQQPWTEGALDGEFYFVSGGNAPAAPPVHVASLRPEPMQQAARPAIVVQPEPQRPATVAAGQSIIDCAECPELVVIPAGNFNMGNSVAEEQQAQQQGAIKTWTDRENPQHSVRVAAFLLGKTEVSVGQWRAFTSAASYLTDAERHAGNFKGCYTKGVTDGQWDWRESHSWKSPGWDIRDDEPVVCISWNDANAYVQWLGKRTGLNYSLPSEAQWEYAARAGTSTSRFWGDDPNQACRYANVTDQTVSPDGGRRSWGDNKHECNDGYYYVAPVGHYKPNAFGIYDMLGNAFEWVQDVFHEDYQGAPTDGSVWAVGGDQSKRVLRGGGWQTSKHGLRSAYRAGFWPFTRASRDGFRIARTL